MDSYKQPLIIRLSPVNDPACSSNSKETNEPFLSESHSVKDTIEDQADRPSAIPDDFLNVAIPYKRKLKNFKRKLDLTWNMCPIKRNFVKNWKKRFPFLEYDTKKKLMFCRICKQYCNERQKGASFVNGTKNFRLSSIRCHENSVLHSNCLKLSQNLNHVDCNFGIGKDKEKVLNTLKSVYFTIKTKYPFNSFPQLCATQKKQCLDIGPAYISHHKVVPYFSKYIALTLEKELSEKLKNLELFSLVLHATFSRADECHELIYIKYIETNAVKTIFVGIINSKNTSGQTIYENLSRIFEKFYITEWAQRVVYIMTDLLSNKSWLNELVEILEKNSSNFICSLPLLFQKDKFANDFFKTHSPTQNFMNSILNIYQYYSKLPDDEKNLPNVEHELDAIVKTYGGLPKNSCVTFNLSSLEAIKRDLDSLLELLKRNVFSDLKNKNLKVLSTINKKDFIMKLALYLDVMSCLTSFANELQDNEFMPFSISTALVKVTDSLTLACKGKGDVFNQCLKDLLLRYPTFPLDQVVEAIIENMQSFLDNLTSSFRNLNTKLTLLKSADIFISSQWCSSDDQNVSSIVDFKEFYSKLLNTASNSESPISDLPDDGFDFPFSYRLQPRTLIWNMINNYPDHSNFKSSLNKILLLDFSDREIMLGYQEMNLVKSADRSSLSVNSLQNSMIIIMHGPSLSEYDPIPAFELWLKQCHRRYHKRTKQRNIPGHDYLENLFSI